MSFDEQPDGDPHGECAAEIHRLTAENEQLRKDAARYRYYRGRAYKDGGMLCIEVANIDDVAIGDFGDFIDETADAAMAEKPKEV